MDQTRPELCNRVSQQIRHRKCLRDIWHFLDRSSSHQEASSFWKLLLAFFSNLRLNFSLLFDNVIIKRLKKCRWWRFIRWNNRQVNLQVASCWVLLVVSNLIQHCPFLNESMVWGIYREELLSNWKTVNKAFKVYSFASRQSSSSH